MAEQQADEMPLSSFIVLSLDLNGVKGFKDETFINNCRTTWVDLP